MNPAIRCHNYKMLKKGATLISVIIVMLIIAVLGISVSSLTNSSQRSSLSANAGTRAYYLAESGLRYAQQVFHNDGWAEGQEQTLDLQDGDKVQIIRIGNRFWATAIVGLGTAKEARARVPMSVGVN